MATAKEEKEETLLWLKLAGEKRAETLRKLMEVGKKLREARELWRYAQPGLRRRDMGDACTVASAEAEIERLQEEAGRICETEL